MDDEGGRSRGDRQTYSRRDFLTGVLATGTLSAGAIYLLPGGRATPTVTLRVVTGDDTTGARELLRQIWNESNPRTQVEFVPVGGSTSDQRAAMETFLQGGGVDVLNLDVIDIPYFQAAGHIIPVDLQGAGGFLKKPLLPSRLGDPQSTVFWAAPFNTDVGLLFERTGQQAPVPGQPELAGVLDVIPAGAGWFAGQLAVSSSATEEAFTVNVLEHAVSRDPAIVDSVTGAPAQELERWQAALEPLRAALGSGRITACDGEDDTRNKFREQQLPYMRNWPVKYRELELAGDEGVLGGELVTRPLPRGVLGGRSLAVVGRSPNTGRAAELVRFLTSVPAQRIIASFGLAPTRIEAYSDSALTALVPYLPVLRGAVEDAVLRPLHRNYSQASTILSENIDRLLNNGQPLGTQFIDSLQESLPGIARPDGG